MTGEHRWIDITAMKDLPNRVYLCGCGEQRTCVADEHGNTPDPDDAPSVPPSSAVQGSVRTEGPDAGPEAQTGFLVQHSGAGPATVWPVTIGPAQPAEGFLEREPSVESRLRSLATAELEAAKGGTRIQKTAAKAAARAYRLAADMIEEEQA